MAPWPRSIRQHFPRLPGPRINRRKRHLLTDSGAIARGAAPFRGAPGWSAAA